MFESPTSYSPSLEYVYVVYVASEYESRSFAFVRFGSTALISFFDVIEVSNFCKSVNADDKKKLGRLQDQ